MNYAESEEGVSALKKTSSMLTEAWSGLFSLSVSLQNKANEHPDALGPHRASLLPALSGIYTALKEAGEPIKAISDALNDTAEAYQDIIDNDRLTQGSSNLSGAEGNNSGAASGNGPNNSSFSEGLEVTQAASLCSQQVADHEFTREEKISWIISSVPATTKTDAERIVHSMEQYSGNGYDSIHWDKNSEMQETKDILQVFDSGKVNAYNGVIYRGLSFDSKRDLMKALSRWHGDWVEPGITSFTASDNVAEDFAKRKNWGLVLTCPNNKSAIPFRHMSLMSWEDEVLSPGAHRNNGWKIDMSSIRVDKTKRIVYAEIKEK